PALRALQPPARLGVAGGRAGEPLVVLDVDDGDVLGDGHPLPPYRPGSHPDTAETCLHTPATPGTVPGPVLVAVLVVLAAPSPDVVCLEPGVCTPVTRVGRAGSAEVVRHEERLPAKIDPDSPFAAWMTWPRPPEAVRRRVEQRQPVELRALIPAAKLRRRGAPGLLT